MYGAPEYLGNRDLVGWRNIGFAGDVQPRGYTDAEVSQPVSRDFDAIIVGSGPGGSTAADVLTAAGRSVVIFERGRNHLIDLENPERAPLRVLQRRDQVLEPPLPRARSRGSSPGPSGSPSEDGRPRATSGRSTTSRPRSAAAGYTPTASCPASGRTTSGSSPSSARSRARPSPTGPSAMTSSSRSTPRPSGLVGVAGDAGANPFAAVALGPLSHAPRSPHVLRRS